MANKHRIQNIVEQGKQAAELLRGVSIVDTKTPYLQSIASASVLLMDTVIIVRKNKEECLKMVEQIGAIITMLVNINNVAVAELPTSVLSHIAKFSETLQKVLAFVRRQAGKSLIKRVVRHLEDSSLLSECQLALDHAVELFKLQCEVTTITSLGRIQADASRNDFYFSHLLMARKSRSTLATFHSRLSDISLLPGSPQIFHGRDAELQHIISDLLPEKPSRIAILGPGGVGKSSLALAALYHPDVEAKFGSERHFISCESSQSAEDIAAALFSHFALQGCTNPTKAILQYLAGRSAPCVVVLDNMETPWERHQGRSAVEQLLSHISSIDSVHIIITMRGEERPGKVRWSRPFLRPLSPLSDLAARQVFRDISDETHSETQVDELLRFTDNLPLAITLMASIVAFEGASSVLARWNSERISLLSEGSDKNSNLSTSIMMSLSSPRLTAIPDALTLLGLLSVLPDGVTESTLAEMCLPPMDIALCRVTLCRTSLAYVDQDRRLKALVPIREHMRAFHPPSPELVCCLQRFFLNLVSLFCKKWARSIGSGLVQRLAADLGNIYSLLQIALETDTPPSTETLSCIIDLAQFTQVTYLGSWDLLHSISRAVEESTDPNLQGQYFVALSCTDAQDIPVKLYLEKAIRYFELTENLSAQAMAYHHLSSFYLNEGDTGKALESSTCALSLARRSDDHHVLAQVLRRMGSVLHNEGNFRRARGLVLEAQAYAQAASDLDAEFICILARISLFLIAGNYTRGAELCAELLLLAKGLGVEKGDRGLNALLMQGEIHFRKTEYDEARRINMAIIDIARGGAERNSRHAMGLMNVCLADLATGADVTLETIEVFRNLYHGVHWTVLCDNVTADLYQRLGEFPQAHNLYKKSLAVARGQYAETTNECFQKLGDNAYARSRMDSAFRYYVLHLALSRRMEDYENMHQALRRIGDIFLHRGDCKTARNLFTLSLNGFTLMDIHKARSDCLFRLGELSEVEGDASTASRCWEQALPLFERSSQKDGARKCRSRLMVCVGPRESDELI
ncbi:hypothetical protein DFH09DRAFT_255159 [Mycena vulgaris]|nr:hypothetical protein DFH09DRAFT_255159 [Mycena vulgaris]